MRAALRLILERKPLVQAAEHHDSLDLTRAAEEPQPVAAHARAPRGPDQHPDAGRVDGFEPAEVDDDLAGAASFCALDLRLERGADARSSSPVGSIR